MKHSLRFGWLIASFGMFVIVAMAQTGNKAPKATPAESLKHHVGFRAELLLTVPQAQYGSWVNLCTDPKGRLIVSDQYGGLFRVTVPAPDTEGSIQIEPIPAAIGEAQGLLWAFDALYVVVNSGSRPSGLYRVTDSNGDDKLDRVELLRPIQGNGEHGPHAVLLHPDGKRLTVVCGNQCRMVDCNTTKVPRVWGEDHLLPRMPDGRGFMKGVLGPGGCIYNVSPDGKEWELYSTGFRNQYDAAYNRQGDLFTYDADMEWDFNTPWYRPTRVCQVVSGSEFGWRNGAGKYPPYYADSAPGILDIGPGSPTGVCFGYGAKFPQKYQDALYICDWSYGKLYAIHLRPQGSVHAAEMEEFVSGTPLPLTDVVVNPVDGAMYFLIGGRKTQSALYRITYTGKTDAKALPTITHSPLREKRLELESFHGRTDPKAVEVAWPELNNSDRFIRMAARIALEHQPVDEWQNKALKETDPHRAITALLALTRVAAPCPSHRKPSDPPSNGQLGGAILAKLNSIAFKNLTNEQQLELLRVYHVLFNRFGQADTALRKDVLDIFEPLFPTGQRFVDAELCQLLVYLEAPSAAAKIVKALQSAATQEEQIEYARALRVLRTGWTPELRKDYFTWMQNAESYRGGNSFGGFLQQIKKDAAATLTPQELALYRAFVNAPVKLNRPAAARPFVKEYQLADLTPVVERGLVGGRDFDRGRKLFAEANCAACHRFDQDGGVSGPDLTQVAGRFSVKDLLESIMDPNKEISDQYAAVEIETEDGRKIIGRIVNHNQNGMTINTNMLDPSATVVVRSDNVASLKSSKQSMMPADSLNTLKEDEIMDLIAYLLSRGDKSHSMFRKR